jgi:lysophospholipase L1-like esterase
LLAPRTRLLAAASAVAALVLTAFTVGSSGASAAPKAASHHHPPVHAGRDYLALGDSVPFGYREAANLPAPNYPDAASFVGYPEDVAAALGLHLANASCPGETTDSFITPGAASNSCENSPDSSPAYRQLFPLHVAYNGTQLAYALNYLKHHRGTRAVSLMIGANDGFLCQETTADHCASELPAVLAKVGHNVATILSAIRAGAHYRGRIVLVSYYSLNYADPVAAGTSQALNSALTTAAAPYGVTVADGYGTFQQAAAQSGGDSCKAGLLTQLTTGGCGVHPSVGGQSLLALAVEKALQHH